MKVLITGGAGFIGSHVADRLLEHSHEVLVVDNFATGRRDNVEPRAGLSVVEATVADAEALADAFGSFGPDQVVHAAASYKDPDDWEEDSRTNAMGTANVVKATRALGLDRLIYFQTALCYGTRPVEQPITLAHPIRPDSSYAISKTAGEQYIELGLPNFVSLRLANAYGPRNLSGPLPTFYRRLTNNQPCFVIDTRRDFIYVDDLVDLVMMALEGRGRGHYHVASGTDFAISELFDAAVATLGIELDAPVDVHPRQPDDAYTILLDPTRTGQDFAWHVTTPLVEGVKRAIEWYQEHAIDETYTHLKVPRA